MPRLDIRLRRLSLATAITALAAIPAVAQTDFGPRAPEAVYVAPAPAPALVMPAPASVPSGSPIHAGANNAADQSLAERVAGALAAEPLLDGATVTVAANNGRVSISGSADSPEQGPIAEQVAREVAGPGAVSGTLSSLGS